jgi:hypothetical protein
MWNLRYCVRGVIGVLLVSALRVHAAGLDQIIDEPSVEPGGTQPVRVSFKYVSSSAIAGPAVTNWMDNCTIYLKSANTVLAGIQITIESDCGRFGADRYKLRQELSFSTGQTPTADLRQVLVSATPAAALRGFDITCPGAPELNDVIVKTPMCSSEICKIFPARYYNDHSVTIRYGELNLPDSQCTLDAVRLSEANPIKITN